MGALVQAGADLDADALARRLNALEANPTLRGMSISARRAFKITSPLRSALRSVMASPPTTTLTAAHTIASPILWPAVSGTGTTTRIGLDNFSIGRVGSPVVLGTTNPDYGYVRWTNIAYGSGGWAGGATGEGQYLASFEHDGAAIEIAMKGLTSAFMLKIDDQFLSLTPQAVPNDGNTYLWYIPFGSTKMRRIDVIGHGAATFGGVWTAQTDTVKPAPLRGPRCIVVGDSFTEGTGSNGPDSWVNTMAEVLGWDDVWASGVGSTGYLAAPGGKNNYRTRFATDVTPYSPDVVMFTGGINDEGSFTAAQVGAEATLLFQQAAASLPNALLIAVAPFYKKGASGLTQRILDYKAAIKAAIQAVGGIFLDPLEMPLPTNYTPDVNALTAGASAGATSLSLSTQPAVRGTYKFPDGTRFQVKSVSGSGPFTVVTDGPIQNAQSSGASLTQVGDCFWTGIGLVGTTTGYGNCDLYVGADGTHPTMVGHLALAQCVAGLLTAALA